MAGARVMVMRPAPRLPWRRWALGTALVLALAGSLWLSTVPPREAAGEADPITTATAREVAEPVSPEWPTDIASLQSQQAAAMVSLSAQPAGSAQAWPAVITERPDYVSPLEWWLLRGAAQQQPHADQALSHMVQFLHFNKQWEAWEGVGPHTTLAARQALVQALWHALPVHVARAELGGAEARDKAAQLLRELAAGDAAQREALMQQMEAALQQAEGRASAAPRS